MLLNCSPGSEKDIISEIRSIDGVVEINGILGKYDMIVKIACENPDLLEKTVFQIRNIDIIESCTLPVLYGQGGTIDDII